GRFTGSSVVGAQVGTAHTSPTRQPGKATSRWRVGRVWNAPLGSPSFFLEQGADAAQAVRDGALGPADLERDLFQRLVLQAQEQNLLLFLAEEGAQALAAGDEAVLGIGRLPVVGRVNA